MCDETLEADKTSETKKQNIWKYRDIILPESCDEALSFSLLKLWNPAGLQCAVKNVFSKT
jgi:hypothetical protein